MTIKGQHHSEIHKQHIKEGRKKSEKAKQSAIRAYESWRGSKHSDESLRKMKEARAHQVITEESKLKRSQTLMGRKKEYLRKLWADPIWRKLKLEKQMRVAKPNKSEIKLQAFLDSYFHNEWKFVGDGQIIIAGKCPDFININGKKALIELFGDYWHKGESHVDREKVFEPYGYSTLVIWERELKQPDLLLDKINNKFYA